MVRASYANNQIVSWAKFISVQVCTYDNIQGTYRFCETFSLTLVALPHCIFSCSEASPWNVLLRSVLANPVLRLLARNNARLLTLLNVDYFWSFNESYSLIVFCIAAKTHSVICVVTRDAGERKHCFPCPFKRGKRGRRCLFITVSQLISWFM